MTLGKEEGCRCGVGVTEVSHPEKRIKKRLRGSGKGQGCDWRVDAAEVTFPHRRGIKNEGPLMERMEDVASMLVTLVTLFQRKGITKTRVGCKRRRVCSLWGGGRQSHSPPGKVINNVGGRKGGKMWLQVGFAEVTLPQRRVIKKW